MNTRFKLLFEGEPDIDLVRFKQSLPSNFEVSKEHNEIFVSLPSKTPEDTKCQYIIDRELDRHFFLTCVKIKATMIKKRVTANFEISCRIHGKLSEQVEPQKWNYNLSVQLRLWSIAVDANEVLLQIILFYQIIELSIPNSQSIPKYTDSTIPPVPIVECRFLRNMAAHSGEVGDAQLKKYCEYLGFPTLLHDPTDPQYLIILKSKLKLLESEAKSAIEREL